MYTKTLGVVLTMAALCPVASFGQWLNGGGDLHNTRHAAKEKKIKVGNVANLTKKWEFVTQGDVSATPTVDGKTVYAVDWGGYLHSINAKTGVANWSRPLSDYTGVPQSVSRTSPVVHGNLLILGDQGGAGFDGFPNFSTTASVMAINKKTGGLVWRTFVSDHLHSLVTSSPVAHRKTVYVGVSSLEEAAGFIPFYRPFTFRSKVVALKTETGEKVWEFYTVPKGYTGAAVWGSTPVVDIKRRSLYVTTGNNYSVPQGVGPNGNPVADDNYIDAVIALNLKTGALKWAQRMEAHDTWDVYRAFVLGGDPDMGPDYDFGSGPNLFTVKKNGKRVDLLGAGQKSGKYWTLNPDTGAVVWVTQVGPGGTGGGIQWGSAVDGSRIYSAIGNSENHPTGFFPTEKYGGLWAGLDAKTGAVLWRTQDPITRPSDGRGGHDFGMVTVANGVVFGGSVGLPPIKDSVILGNTLVPGVPGGMFALDAATGQILWSFLTDGAVICGPSVVKGTVYWGSGYSHLSEAFGISGNPRLYAFSLTGEDHDDE